jgi:tRNA(Ile2) C34 agmatinyltransferase TiaS
MPYCPECGGEMHYISVTRRYACKSCGLMLSHQEIMEIRDRFRDRPGLDEDEKKRYRKEYLQWWLSKKKK